MCSPELIRVNGSLEEELLEKHLSQSVYYCRWRESRFGLSLKSQSSVNFQAINCLKLNKSFLWLVLVTKLTLKWLPLTKNWKATSSFSSASLYTS